MSSTPPPARDPASPGRGRAGKFLFNLHPAVSPRELPANGFNLFEVSEQEQAIIDEPQFQATLETRNLDGRVSSDYIKHENAISERVDTLRQLAIRRCCWS